ncbi:MAG: hypothetical protein ACOC8E_04395 [Planctomycetota bacterium]
MPKRTTTGADVNSLVVIYVAKLGGVGSVTNVLARNGFDLVPLDNPNPVVQYRGQLIDYCVRIGVPRGQAQAARQALAEWERQNVSDVDRHTREARRTVAGATLSALLVALACIPVALVWSPAIFAIPVVVWLVAASRLSHRPKDGPPGDKRR